MTSYANGTENGCFVVAASIARKVKSKFYLANGTGHLNIPQKLKNSIFKAVESESVGFHSIQTRKYCGYFRHQELFTFAKRRYFTHSILSEKGF